MKLNGHHVDQMLQKWLGIRHVSRDGYLGILIDSGAESETLDHADVHESTRYIGRQDYIDSVVSKSINNNWLAQNEESYRVQKVSSLG